MSEYINTLIAVNRVLELRVIGARGIVGCGFFNDGAKLEAAVTDFGLKDWNFYTTINAISPEHIPEVKNAITTPIGGGGVKDAWILRRTFLPFDLDPVRPSGTASTDDECLAAEVQTTACRDYLTSIGWPLPIKAMSGSGHHNVYRVDLPSDDGTNEEMGLLYSTLGERFGTETVKFDMTVRNPSRIIKLYGTRCWYKNTSKDRPARISRVWIPERLSTVPRVCITRAIMGSSPVVKKKPAPRKGRGNLRTLDMLSLFKSHDMVLRDIGDGKTAVRCPWSSEHTTESPTSTVVFYNGPGAEWAFGFKCLHAHCERRGASDIAEFFQDSDKFCQETSDIAVSAGHPNEVAARMLESHDVIKVILGTTFEYNGVTWDEVDDWRLGALYAKYEQPKMNTQRRRSEGVNFIKTARATKVDKWNNVAKDEIAFQEGVYGVMADTMRDHRREDFIQCVVPHRLDRGARDFPRWDQCLGEWFGGDTDAAAKTYVLQEMFGQALLPHNAFKKALVMLGDTDTGKSLAIRVAEEVVGEKNTTHLSIDSMGDDKACSVLAGKLLNTINDVGRNERLDDGGFKRLTGGDEIVVDEKYIRRYSYRPIATHFMACNTLPKIDDKTQAVFNRLIILSFNRKIPKADQDRWLLDKLRVEMPAIVNWAIEGAHRLIKQNDFTTCPSSEKMVYGYKMDQNDAAGFIAAEMVFDQNAKGVLLSDFRERLAEWLRVPTVRPRTVRDMVRGAGYIVDVVGNREVLRGLVWRGTYGNER